MEKIKIEVIEQGVCPYCGSQEITYNAIRFENDMLYFPCECETCKRYFEEWHTLHFEGHNVGSSGEYEAVLNAEIEYKE